MGTAFEQRCIQKREWDLLASNFPNQRCIPKSCLPWLILRFIRKVVKLVFRSYLTEFLCSSTGLNSIIPLPLAACPEVGVPIIDRV
jgi:hypothetical protein